MKNQLMQKLTMLNVETPHLVFVEEIIEKNIEHILKSSRSIVNLSIFYSVKACYHPGILEVIKKHDVGFEVMTEMELDVVLKVEQSPNKIITNGIGRSISYLEKAYLNNHTIIIDSLGDLAKLDVLTKEHKKQCIVGIRINTGDQDDISRAKFIFSKLGIIPFSEEYFSILDTIVSNPYFSLNVIHTHNSINENNIYVYKSAFSDLEKVYLNIKDKYKINSITTIDIGGGFSSNDNQENLSVSFEELFTAFNEKFPRMKCAVEPGRNIVNDAGFMITKVTDIKIKSGKHYIFVDATTNVLIPIPTAQYKISHPAASNEGFNCSLVDSVLSPNNIISDNFFLTEIPSIGDTIVISNCGAYTSSMGAYWGFDLIPVSLLTNNHELVPVLSKEAIKKSKNILIG